MRINELQNFDLSVENMPDSELMISKETLAHYSRQVLALNGEKELEGIYYIEAINLYTGELSPGQRQVYEYLLEKQDSDKLQFLKVGRAAKDLNIGVAAFMERLANCKSLGAIIGKIP